MRTLQRAALGVRHLTPGPQMIVLCHRMGDYEVQFGPSRGTEGVVQTANLTLVLKGPLGAH